MAGLYIPDMQMPTDCSRKGCHNFACVAAYNTGMICTILNQYVEPNKQNAKCPLHFVPDHGRLIDGDALIQTLNDDGIKYDSAVNHRIMYAPTIIPADKEAVE